MAVWHNDGEMGIVVSSRVRLARNFENTPFPQVLSDSARAEIVEKVDKIFEKNKNFVTISCDNALVMKALMEENLVSHNFASDTRPKGIISSMDNQVVIMINEEDHLRIQCIKGGNSLNEAYLQAKAVDDIISKNITVAYSDTYGYKTACPTNMGTGMRASVMLHLPAISINGGMGEVSKFAMRFGLTIRGIFGEGSSGHGHFYQVSNQVTLGASEQDIIKKVNEVVDAIVKRESELRQKMLEQNESALKDMVYRAKGVLQNAYMITTKEMVEKLSELYMGVCMAIIDNIEKHKIISAMFSNMSSGIMVRYGEMDDISRDIKRAEVLRDEIGGE